MVTLIQGLRKPVIHYKILAAGRNAPDAAFAFLLRTDAAPGPCLRGRPPRRQSPHARGRREAFREALGGEELERTGSSEG